MHIAVARFETMVETVSFRAFLEANWGCYGYGYLRWPGVEVTDETGKLPRYARLCYICAKFRLHPIVFPSSSARGRHLVAHYCTYGYSDCGIPTGNN